MNAVVQRLGHAHAADILTHFGALPGEDLRLRFGAPVSCFALEKYVSGIDFSNDRVFGILGSESGLAAVAHLAVNHALDSAELGLSVAPASRRCGYGEALLRRGSTHASSLGMRTIYMHCLSENTALMALARKTGFRIVVASGEVDATKQLDEAVAQSIAMDLLSDQIALVDSALRKHLQMLRSMAELAEPAVAA